MPLEGMTVKQTMQLKILELPNWQMLMGAPSWKKEMFYQSGVGRSKHG